VQPRRQLRNDETASGEIIIGPEISPPLLAGTSPLLFMGNGLSLFAQQGYLLQGKLLTEISNIKLLTYSID